MKNIFVILKEEICQLRRTNKRSLNSVSTKKVNCIQANIVNSVLEQRKEESQKIIEKYPDKVPIICEKAAKSNLPDNERSK